MSIREKLRKGLIDFTGRVEQRFGRTGTPRPNTLLSEQTHINTPSVDRQIANLETGATGPPSASSTPIIPLASSPPGNNPNIDTRTDQSALPIHSTEEDPAGVKAVPPGAQNLGSQAPGAGVEPPVDQNKSCSRPVSIAGPGRPPNPAESNETNPGEGSVLQASCTTSAMRKGLKELGRVLGPVSSMFGPIKEVVGVIEGCIDTYEMSGAAKIEYDGMRVRLEAIIEDLKRYFEDGHSLTMTTSMESICGSIQAELGKIQRKLEENRLSHYLEASDEADAVIRCYQRIELDLQRLALNANWETMKDVKEQVASARIDRLSPSLSARYNSAEAYSQLKRQACTPGTRINVLDHILDWARSGDDGSIYWLNGMAGTGKTTIAYSLCDKLQTERKLAASFFCSRLREECRLVERIIPSIAYQLARFSLPFLSVLSAALQKDLDVHSSSLSTQFDELIAKPLRVAGDTLPKGLVVVIDALDECENKESTGQILDILLNRGTGLSVRFLVSSRPEAEIRDRMTDEHVKSRLVLHELGRGEVQADIETYLRKGLAPMRPSEEAIAELVARAGILFIYAATAVRYIGYDNFRRNPSLRLRTILDSSQTTSTTKNKEIDQLYGTVLRAALEDQELGECERDDMQQVLRTVICAREPLAIKGISGLLQINDVDRVHAALRPMWSVLHIAGESEIVTTLHASFPDFMFDSARSKSYYCDSNAHQRRLAEFCLEYIVQAKPQLNICGLQSSHLPDQQVPDIEKKVADAISPELLYACRYWSAHVNAASCVFKIIEHIRDFLSTRLLLWMEILNLKNEMKAGVECVKLVNQWFKGFEGEPELAEVARDAKRFVEAFALNPVSRSTPHIYVSMLAFWPKSTPIIKHYARYTQGPVVAEGTALDRRQLAHLSTWAFKKGIEKIAVSADGLYVGLAIGKDVVVVDSSSGKVVLGPLRGHPETVTAVGFSPDGSRILAGSFGSFKGHATILGWDARSGGTELGPLQFHGHRSWMKCLTFSPDCSCLATGSDDKTTRLWNMRTGETLLQLEAQHGVKAVVFSPDGTRVAAGLGKALQVWDSQSGDTVVGRVTVDGLGEIDLIALSPDNSRIVCTHTFNKAIQVGDVQGGNVVFRQIAEHPVHVTCIAYSPDGKHIVSGSADRAVRMWDIETGNMVLGPLQAHTGYVSSVTFTPGGSRIISACDAGLVCTWDAQHHSLIPNSTDTLSQGITCVKFSSGSAHLVSGSEEGAICIWDAGSGEVAMGPVKVHTNRINAVDFNHDRVVSGSLDGKICVCDARTGEVVLGPFEVGSETIRSIAYSPDGNLIATGSSTRVDVWNAQDGNRVLGPLTDLRDDVWSVRFSPDGTHIVASSIGSSSNVVVWDISDGRNVGTLDGHHNSVPCVSYSPNGALIASCGNATITLWDARTGKKAIGPLTGHSDWVYSASFSPDSTRLVSGSSDETIRIWDVQTGQMLFELAHEHEGRITSVEYSPDGTRILSRSDDGSVRIHDARSPKERAQSRSEFDVGDWTIDKDGWVVDDQSRLLAWVPGDLRKALMWPSTLQIRVPPQEHVWLKFDKFRMGESWAQGYTSNM